MGDRRALVINWIEGRPSLSGGVKSNRLLAEAMARRGHRVVISHLPPTPPWPPAWRVRRFSKRVREQLKPGRFDHHLQQSAVPTNQMPGRAFDLDRIPDADVTIASWWRVWSQVWGWPASKGLKLHLVRGHEVFNGPEDQVRAAYRLPGPRAVISGWLETIMRDYGHEDIVRVPNGVKWEQFDSRPRGKQRVPTVGFLASVETVKRCDVALRAIRLLQQSAPDLRVISFGQKSLPTDWDLPNNFEFHLRPAQDEISGFYRSCDCWLTSSESEGFGMPGLEAAAGHCPLVSTRCGGPEDYVEHGRNGFLVDVGDADGMAEAMGEILGLDDHAWREMSEASYEIAKAFDWDRSAERLESAIVRWLASGWGGTE